jgi:glycosyltransferase involved in cell wall biosynthesis
MPTHNRARYAIHAVQAILAIEADDLELVVHDTSEGPSLRDFASTIDDPRLRYIHSAEALSMTENHNRAMGSARGHYVCLIGDDDSILPEALVVARWAAQRRVLAVAPETVVSYLWPDFRSRAFGTRHAGRLYMKRHFGAIGVRDARSCLLVSLARGALGTRGLPKVYHGIVAREVLEQVKLRGGAYFYGISPDVSGAISVASLIERFIVMDYPLTIPGSSAGSNAGRNQDSHRDNRG